MKEEKGRDLTSLGYVQTETLDWTRVQLPKKQDLFQEFYRRIHNFMYVLTVCKSNYFISNITRSNIIIILDDI